MRYLFITGSSPTGNLFLLIITYTFEKKRKCFATENKKAVVSFGFEI